jgi:hypothetical protein
MSSRAAALIVVVGAIAFGAGAGGIAAVDGELATAVRPASSDPPQTLPVRGELPERPCTRI